MSSTATTNDSNVALNIEEIVGLMPLPVQDEARLAFYAEWNGEFERAAELAAGLLEKVPYQDELRLLRMRSLFSGGRLQEAKDLCQELLRELPEEDEPHLYMGLICHAFGSYQQAVRELDAIYPPDTYYPYYYSTYGDCLEKLGRREQAR
ncbi:MAG: tetratricopeptide repeat protein, partial [Lachnospiraceae bacterium]|nr:tetratricopeptide repeat protein [Lachnospiraceae bacterium]